MVSSSAERFDHCRRWNVWSFGVTAANTRLPVRCRPHEDAATIGGMRKSFGEAGPLESIDQSCGVGRPVQQAVGNGAHRHSRIRIVGQAERPQRHVLLVRDALGLADPLQFAKVAVGEQQHVEVHIAPH